MERISRHAKLLNISSTTNSPTGGGLRRGLRPCPDGLVGRRAAPFAPAPPAGAGKNGPLGGPPPYDPRVPATKDTLREAGAIRKMFSGIAPRYDCLNHLLSANRDRRWRGPAAALATEPGPSLDVCAGTGDLTLLFAARPTLAVGADFCEEMLVLGREKARRVASKAAFLAADTLRLPFRDGAFATVSAAFGIRNVADLRGGIREMTRVARPGGQVVILEFTTPENPIVRGLYLLYFLVLLPLAGNLLSGSRDGAYGYLPRSVRRFPGRRRLAEILEGEGLTDVRVHDLSLGIVNALVGRKAAGGGRA